MYMDDICPWCYNKAEHHVDHETTRSLLKGAAKFGAKHVGGELLGDVGEGVGWLTGNPGLAAAGRVGGQIVGGQVGKYLTEQNIDKVEQYFAPTSTVFKCPRCNASWTPRQTIEDYLRAIYNKESPLNSVFMITFVFLIPYFVLGFILLMELLLEVADYVLMDGNIYAYSWGWICSFAKFSWKFYAIVLGVTWLYEIIKETQINSRYKQHVRRYYQAHGK